MRISGPHAQPSFVHTTCLALFLMKTSNENQSWEKGCAGSAFATRGKWRVSLHELPTNQVVKSGMIPVIMNHSSGANVRSRSCVRVEYPEADAGLMYDILRVVDNSSGACLRKHDGVPAVTRSWHSSCC